jgi:hypothetical protein
MLDALDADRVPPRRARTGRLGRRGDGDVNQNRLVTLTLVGAAGLKPRVGEIHDPMLAGFIDYVWLGAGARQRPGRTPPRRSARS